MIFESVNQNKTKTTFIVILFFILIGLFVYFLAYIFGEDSELAFIIATIVSSISSIISYFLSDKIVIKANHAREATREEYLELNEILEALCLGAGLPKPKLYVMDSSSPNAFATGRNPNNAVVCVTTGLLEKLDKYELEGVIAHELSHIKNYDILLSTVATVMVGGISIIADSISRGFFRTRSDDDDSKAGAIIMIIGLIFIILAPIFSKLLQLTLSRNREYLADSSAVQITRNKDGLINALKKISSDPNVVTTANKATASMYIADSFKTRERDSLFSTHPSTANRIKRLENIK